MDAEKADRTRIAMMIAAALAVLLLAALEALAGDETMSWARHVRVVDEALAQRDVSVATRALHSAYSAALASRRWDAMIDVGDAALRVGDVSGVREPGRVRARRNYILALIRAKEQGSVDGMLRVARAFDALGDRGVADRCVRIAEKLAARSQDDRARARVRAFARGTAAADAVGTPRASVSLTIAR